VCMPRKLNKVYLLLVVIYCRWPVTPQAMPPAPPIGHGAVDVNGAHGGLLQLCAATALWGC
jgi:hypothetical protein